MCGSSRRNSSRPFKVRPIMKKERQICYLSVSFLFSSSSLFFSFFFLFFCSTLFDRSPIYESLLVQISDTFWEMLLRSNYYFFSLSWHFSSHTPLCYSHTLRIMPLSLFLGLFECEPLHDFQPRSRGLSERPQSTRTTLYFFFSSDEDRSRRDEGEAGNREIRSLLSSLRASVPR